LASGPLSAARSHRKRCTSHRHRLFITRHLHRFTSRHLSMSRQHPSTLDRGITGIGIEVIDARASNLSSVSTRPSSRGAGIPSTGRAMSCCDQLSALPQLRSAVPRQALELSPSHLLNLTAVWPRSGSSSHSRLLGISFLPILGVKSRYCGVCFLRIPARRGRLPINTRHTQRHISGKGCRDFTSTRPPERL
jgi:hypothetical protein